MVNLMCHYYPGYINIVSGIVIQVIVSNIRLHWLKVRGIYIYYPFICIYIGMLYV